jgi:glutamate-5-semialdehyde dehydrogenase
MSTMAQTGSEKDGAVSSVAQIARRARVAARAIARLSADFRNEILESAAKALEANRERILAANDED